MAMHIFKIPYCVALVSFSSYKNVRRSCFLLICNLCVIMSRTVRLDGNKVEAGSNTSTVTLRVVRGDEKGSLKTETVKYGSET
jgi:hypothetical protein